MSSTGFEGIEEKVSDQTGSYKGLTAEALLTSAEDFERIFRALPQIQTWVEPGSGQGLGPVLFAKLNPKAKSVGIEFELARYEASLTLKKTEALSNVTFIHGDLLTTELPPGDSYFLYFPTGMVLDKILHQLGQFTQKVRIVAIESHGDLLPRLRKETWLKEVLQIPLNGQRHSPNAVVFEGTGPQTPSLHDVSFHERYLLIEDQNSSLWLAESLGLEWIREEEYLLACPPRSVLASQVKAVLLFAEIEQKFRLALHLRRLGELQIESGRGTHTGVLRKIFVSPSFKVELSTGEQVEWSQIKKIFWENILCFDSSSDYCFYPLVV